MQRLPIIGPAFDAHQGNLADNLRHYCIELDYYAPRKSHKLRVEAAGLLRRFETADDDNAVQDACEWWIDDADALLTEVGRKRARNDYLVFGIFPDGSSVGYYVDIEAAELDASALVEDTAELPKGFTGLALVVNDHGNASLLNYSRGRMVRAVFAVV